MRSSPRRESTAISLTGRKRFPLSSAIVISLRLLPAILLPVLLLSLVACTTLENRRDLYFPETVWGPYTRMIHRGIPKPTPPPAVHSEGAVLAPFPSDKNVVPPEK